ncbi:hypothetical protein, partial [Plasmodium yoelii yoelii]
MLWVRVVFVNPIFGIRLRNKVQNLITQSYIELCITQYVSLFDKTLYLVKLIICIICFNLNRILITEQYNNIIYE